MNPGYCQGKIAHYKIPRYVRFTAEFPMTVSFYPAALTGLD